MNRGLLWKACWETWTLTALCGLGLLLIEAVEGYALVTLRNEFSMFLANFPVLEKLMQMLAGADRSLGKLGPDAFPAIAWAHPLALVLMWMHAAAFCTRMPAGEVDRGSIDVLLGLPVSRIQLQVNESLAWVASSAVLLVMFVVGNRMGNALAHGPAIEPWRLAMMAGNLLCLYLAVGALAWFVSSLSDRRGRAGSVVAAFVLFCFLLSYLQPFWSVAERLSFLSLLHYYVPLRILRDGIPPVRDVLVLGGIGGVFWVAAGLVFVRRDLSTL
ncbi:MAG: ABC transporter permease subunit [Rhodopirellula sp.]|nr:ABC transporter permease subunit [Rhodopirellula sp.]